MKNTSEIAHETEWKRTLRRLYHLNFPVFLSPELTSLSVTWSHQSLSHLKSPVLLSPELTCVPISFTSPEVSRGPAPCHSRLYKTLKLYILPVDYTLLEQSCIPVRYTNYQVVLVSVSYRSHLKLRTGNFLIAWISRVPVKSCTSPKFLRYPVRYTSHLDFLASQYIASHLCSPGPCVRASEWRHATLPANTSIFKLPQVARGEKVERLS